MGPNSPLEKSSVVNHKLHIVLSVLTFGSWLPIYVAYYFFRKFYGRKINFKSLMKLLAITLNSKIRKLNTKQKISLVAVLMFLFVIGTIADDNSVVSTEISTPSPTPSPTPTPTSSAKPSTKSNSSTDSSDTSIAVPNGTVVITPTQVAELNLTKSNSGNTAKFAISQLKNGQRVRVTVIAKQSLESKTLEVNKTQISEIQPGLSKPKLVDQPAKIDIKSVPKVKKAETNKAEISVTGVKKNQRVRVTVKSK